MTNEQQALIEMPVWMVILLSLVGGISGEAWRADKAGVSGWSLVRRLLLRSGACVVCGLSTMMLLHASGMSVLAAGSIGCLTAMAGADVAIGLYERWAAKRLGVCDVPPRAMVRRDVLEAMEYVDCTKMERRKVAGDPGEIRGVRGMKPAGKR